MKKTRLLFARYLTLLILALLSTNLAWGEISSTSTFTEKTFSQLADGDVVIFASSSSKAMSNATQTTGKPAQVGVTISGNAGSLKITPESGSLDGIAWTLDAVTGGFTFYQYGSTKNRLCITSTSSNTAAKVTDATSSYTTMAMGASGKNMQFVGATRFLGCYTSGSDWRTYNTEDANNYGGTSTKFYVLNTAPVAVEAPTFTPAETAFWESTSVSLACATEGASIYYTLDGTEPTKASTQYTEAINISETTTIKAIAYKGDDASNVATKTYTKIVPLTTMDAIFNASATTGDYWITFNNWVVSGVKNSNAYITDNAGKGLIVYKSGHGFVAGDILSGTVKCALTKYNGSAEITNLTSTTEGLTVTKNGTVNTVNATIANLGGVNTGAYINLGALTYNGSEFTDGTNTIKPYNTFITLPTLTNGKKYYVKGIYIQYNSTKEIAPLTEEDFAEVPATEYNITITPCENGYVTVDAENNKAQAGQVVTLTITPDKGYKLGSLTVTDESSNPIYVSGNKFIMPASDVTVSATFEAIPTHDAKFFVNGVQYGETQNVPEGDEVVFPEEDPAAIGTRHFVGWTASPMAEVSDEAPEFVKSATMGTENLNFYAVFAKKTEGDGNYEKVTTAPADWCGKYLIVYETDKLAFDGSLTTLDAVGNTKEVEILNNVIASSEAMDAIAFTVAYKTGSSTVYSLKSASGYYISGTAAANKASNGLKQADTDKDYEISFNGITVESKSSDQQMVLKYNKASDQKRFRFYKSGQQDIALYKKQGTTYSGYCTTVVPCTFTVEVNENAATGLTTMYLDYATEIPEGAEAWYVSGYDADKDCLTMAQITGCVPANTAVIVKGTAGESYDFVETFEDADPVSVNLLVGSVTDDEATDYDENDGWYYLALSGNFKKYVGEGIVRKANKAYLHLTDRSWPYLAKELTIDWETTGIKNLTPALSEGKGVYNLQGVRVNNDYQGVVIMNGKKYINK